MLSLASRPRRRQAGTSMIEVLVSIVIVVLGLLGLAGLQSHAALAEAESFQRAQAIMLLQDMVDRINANRLNAMQYVTTAPKGTDVGVQPCGALTVMHERDLCEWSNALLGASETSGGGGKVGAMIGARGCIENTVPVMPRQFVISVVWQGVAATKAPATTCGSGLYGDDKTRRALTSTVTIGCLQNDPASGLCIFPP
ncbi:MAG TPA: type IV pilus modification protein PilV [Usitatibacter sp.]|nr:type IV pilus modification protein PilV [Usitatibacter sp.]